MQERITAIINKYVLNATLDSLLERGGSLYIMIEVQSKIDDVLSDTVEQALMKELKIPIKLCFTNTQPEKKRGAKAKKKIPGVKKVIMI